MKKVLAFFLVSVMLFSVVACSVPENVPGEGTRPVGNGTDTNNPHKDPGLPAVWYDNQSFRIMASDDVENDNPARDVIYFEDKQSDAINEAVHDRNIYVEETYGVSIEAYWPKEDMKVAAENAINAGLPNCEIMEATMEGYTALIDRGYLTDLNSMSSYLDLHQPWWDQNCRESMSIGGALYVIAGDIMITDKMFTWAITFNRDMIVNYNLEDPYMLVDSYRWTFDKMYEMAAAVSDAATHPTGDVLSINWGVASEYSNTYYMWFGCGAKFFSKDENDIPVMEELTELHYDAMRDIAAMQYDDNVTLLAQKATGVSGMDGFGVKLKVFREGHALFFIGSMTMIEWLREYDMDFGVLPMPMANEAQRSYHSGITRSGSRCMAVPKFFDYTQSDRDFIAIITQALGCESTATLLEAYYDKTLTYRGLRKPEDQRMLDLVFDGRVYDLSLLFTWANALIQEIEGANTEGKIKRIKSSYDAYKTSIDKRVNDYLIKHGIIS